MTESISRRAILTGAAGTALAAGAAPLALAQGGPPATPGQPSPAQPTHGAEPMAASNQPARAPLFFLNDEEARFLEAVVDRLIPPDDQWPGAAWAGVVSYIDRQLGSDWGAGARMYLRGPWIPDAPPQQGYQLRHPPAELYRIGIAETRAHATATYGGREFHELAPEVMDEVLKGLESGAIALPSIPAPVFFETLLANTIEGFFSDPAYGGNRDMVGWRLVGFPGAYASYVDLVDQYDFAYERAPISFADEHARKAHLAAGDH
jgi:gluconate 2-dehydrogenase gamma chain